MFRVLCIRPQIVKSCVMYTVSKEIKCGGNSKILHELVCDTTRKLEKRELIRVVS